MKLPVIYNAGNFQIKSGQEFFALPDTITLARRILMIALLALPVQTVAANLPSKGGISYISGGIGVDERKTFLAQARDYNLHLTFAQQKTGSYLADVHVSIKNMKGETVLDTVSEGPLFYAKLPSGNYRVEAVYRGKSQSKKTSLATRPSRVIFYWPE